jgi:hypothetical protein
MTAVRHRLRAAVRLLPLLAVGLVLLGCTEPEASSTTTSERSEPTSSSSAPPDPQVAAVLDAYQASWAAFGAFVNGAPPGEPADYFEGDHLVGVLDRIREYAADGLELRGEADLAPSGVEVVGTAASLVDCQIDRTYAVERSTGEVVIPASGRPQLVVVELVRDGGRWKVSSVDYGAEGSCER